MKQIRFRAWDGNKMWYWDSKSPDGNPITFQFFADGIGWGVYDNCLGNRLVTGDEKAIFNTPGKLMQFTGLHDKNGKDIYEGDVITDGSYADMSITFKGVIGFDKGSWIIIKSNCDCGECLNDRIERYEDIEIIGNIYESPSLLTSKTNG